METKDPHRNKDHAARLHLVSVKQQVDEGKQEVAKNEAHADPPPSSLLTHIVPEGFFGNIGVIDQEILGEADVSPKYSESQHKAAKVVEVAPFEQTCQGSVLINLIQTN